MATYTVLSPFGAAEVQAQCDLATADGDVVFIPASSVGWTEVVAWSPPPNATLMGAGTTATGGGDQTVIIDDSASTSPLMNISINPTGRFRMTGLTVQSGTGALKEGGTLRFNGPGKLRIDHSKLSVPSYSNSKILFLYVGIFGVMDHCILDLWDYHTIYMYNGRRGVGDNGANYEWTLPTNFGSADNFFIEDSIFTGHANNPTDYFCRVFDGYSGSRIVVRFNDLLHCTLGETHAVGHDLGDRGTRSQEIYCNRCTRTDLTRSPQFCAIDTESGTAMIWGNDWASVFQSLYLFKIVRINNQAYTQGATPNGWGYAGTEFNGTGSMWDGGTALGTDLVKGYPCLDQPGRGQGDLIVGDVPNKVNDTTGTIYWPNQELDPVYIWANAGDIVHGWGEWVMRDNTNGRMAPNRDYYVPDGLFGSIQSSPTSPFDGSSGAGWGTLANRPTTCTTGVAYFATDQGAWNESATNPYGVQMNGASGVLYKATATDTWTLAYTPHVYPHELQSAAATVPDAPTNLVLTPLGP